MKTKILLFALMVGGLSIQSTLAESQTVRVLPKYDTTLRQSSSTNYGTNTQIEIKQDGANTFAGVFSFEMPNLVGKKISKATFHIVSLKTNNVKSMGMYAYPYDFDNSTVWNTNAVITSQIQEQIGTSDSWLDPIQSFDINGGSSNKSIWEEDVEDRKPLNVWTNNVDITNNIGKFLYDEGAKLNILLFHSGGNSALFCSAERNDFSDKGTDQWYNEWSGDELKPYLELTLDDEDGFVSRTLIPLADTYIRKGNTTKQNSAVAMEIYDYATNDAHFYGLMGFSLPDNISSDTYELASAILRLTTVKQGNSSDLNMNLYDYPDFKEDTIYATEETNVNNALDADPVTSFVIQGQKNKATGDQVDAEYLNVASWQNKIDLTDYLKEKFTANTSRFNLLLKRNGDENRGVKIATQDAEDLYVKDSNNVEYTFAKEDLVPQLTLVFSIKEEEVKEEKPETPEEPQEVENEPAVETPAAGQEGEEDVVIETLHFSWGENVTVAKHENADKEDLVITATPVVQTKSVNEPIVLEAEITSDYKLKIDVSKLEAGTYNINVPKGYLKIGDNGVNKEINYEFTSTRSTNEDGNGETSGIAGIAADANGIYSVYNLQGMKVLSTNDASEIKGIKKGIYIINGKKVVLGR